jgi:pimeloyl-ACP methyl ester carboxylesterase
MAHTSAIDYLDIPGARKHVVDTGRGRVAYITAGSGPPLLLLHGLGATSETWRPNIATLAKTHRVVAPDLPGHGESRGPRMLTSVEPLVEAMDALCDAMGIEEASVLGHSLGGLVAMRFALDHGDRVTKLVLVDAGGIGREMSWLLRLASIPVIGGLVFLPATLTVRAYGARVFRPPGDVSIGFLKSLHHSQVNHVTANAVRRAVRSTAEHLGPVDNAYLLPRLHEIDAPVLVIWGAQDRLFPVSQLEGVRNVSPEVRVHVFTDVGHWPYAESPDMFNALVTDFLA